jgi:hypothetical protein
MPAAGQRKALVSGPRSMQDAPVFAHVAEVKDRKFPFAAGA